MKLGFLIFLFIFLCEPIFFCKNFLKSKIKSKTRKNSLNFKNYEILKEGWLQICVNPQGMIPDFKVNPLYAFEKQQNNIPNQQAFYFRLSGKNLFYTQSDTDMKVLGALSIVRTEKNRDIYSKKNCFSVSNIHERWLLCPCSGTNDRWIEIIANQTIFINKSENIEKNITNTPPSGPIIQTKEIVKQPILLIPLPSSDCSKGWNYVSHGLDWQCSCKEGFQQSPIDIRSDCAIQKENMLAPRFEYFKVKKDEFKWVFEDLKLKIKRKKQNNKIELGRIYDYEGRNIYQAHEIHFHTPSEHTINGIKFDLEVQIIHQTLEGEFKNKAVLSLLYQKEPGAKIKFFQGVDMVNLPNPLIKNNLEAFKNDFSVYDFLDEEMITPPFGEFSFYRYEGSFTSPPCEENVIWFVVSDILPIGSTTLEILKDSLEAPKMHMNFLKDDEEEHEDLGENDDENDEDHQCFLKKSIIDGNYRELQNLNSREVHFFDKGRRCFHQSPFNKRKKGHYEKVSRTLNEYLWVHDDKPTGLPNSFVVPEEEISTKERKNIWMSEKKDRNSNYIRNINYLGSNTKIQTEEKNKS